MRFSQTVWVAVVAAGAVILVFGVGTLIGLQRQAEGGQTWSSAYSDSSNGLRLSLWVNSTKLMPGQSIQINVSEYNRLATINNVSAGSSWKVSGLVLGPCGNGIFPFGIEVLRGRYSEVNVSQARALQIYPPATCPLLLRLITGYLFQPMNYVAIILPSYGNASPTKLAAHVTATGEYTGLGRPSFNPGTYTVVAGNEWGSLVFLYFIVYSPK